jgi:phage shock protein PspC (stress-responsive transcriptional regulator)
MNAQAQTMVNNLRQPRRLVCGVCASLADASGVPVVIIRAAAIVLLIAHTVLTAVAYLLAAAWMRRPPSAVRPDYGAAGGSGRGPDAPMPPIWDRNGVVDRFRRLDERLARMEAETFQNEASLRRAFHDLERHP